MNKEEFISKVTSIRNVEKALKKINYPIDIAEIKRRHFSRSLYVAENIKRRTLHRKKCKFHLPRLWTTSKISKKKLKSC